MMNLTTKKTNLRRALFSSSALASILEETALTTNNLAQAEQYTTNNKEIQDTLISHRKAI